MGLNNTARNLMLDALGAVGVRISLHTADPSTTGVNEVTGGSYVRTTITWAAAAAGNLDSTAVVEINVPAATTITHFGIWNAAGSVFYGGAALPAPVPYIGAGQYAPTDLDITLA